MKDEIPKMDAFQTYVALVKGYCALVIIAMPKSFQRGGYLFSPIMLFLNGILQYICALKLVQVGQHHGIYSYPLITLKAFGPNAKRLIDLMIAITQFTFVLSYITFITVSM